MYRRSRCIVQQIQPNIIDSCWRSFT